MQFIQTWFAVFTVWQKTKNKLTKNKKIKNASWCKTSESVGFFLHHKLCDAT